MYLTSSGRGFLPLVSWDQAVTPVYIVLTATCAIQGKEEECMIHIRGIIVDSAWPPVGSTIIESILDVIMDNFFAFVLLRRIARE